MWVLSVTVQIFQRAPSNVLSLPSWWEDAAAFVAGYYIEIRSGIFQVICDEMTQRVASCALCDPPSKEVVLSLICIEEFSDVCEK